MMRMLLVVLQPAEILIEQGDTAHFRAVLDGIDEDHPASPFHRFAVPEQIRPAADDLRVFRQPGVARQTLRYMPPDAFIAHQRVAQADHQHGLHRLRTRWTEHEMQGS